MAGQVKRTTSSRGEGVAALRKKIADLQKELGQRTAALDDALEQQSATAEVLGVINSSPGGLAPVFDAMLEKATRLCEAAFGIMNTYDGGRFHTVALHRVPPAFSGFMTENQPVFKPGTGPARVLGGERVVQIVDAMDSDLYRSGDPDRRALVALA